MEPKQLVEIAMKTRESVYAQYSNFKVEAALMTQPGKVLQEKI